MASAAESVVSIADMRLIQRLRQGEPDAFGVVWNTWRGRAWSACRAMTEDRDGAVALLSAVYRGLPRAVRGWDAAYPLCCLVSTHLYRTIREDLELLPLSGITVAVPTEVRAPDADQARARLHRLEPSVRLVYIADLFFGCSASILAELAQETEQDLRDARAVAAYAVATGGAS